MRFSAFLLLFSFLFCMSGITNAQQRYEDDWFGKRIRRIHMDFHNPEVAPDLMIKDFDAKRYVSTLKNAHVNSLVTFTKCHHGNSYYNTKIGHKHSGLPEGVDMFGEILKECHLNDIKVIAYYSIMWDSRVERDHPDWMIVDLEGNRQRTGYWNLICLNSPYGEEIVFPQLRELTKNYDMDAFWLDIIFPRVCFCPFCQAKYQELYNRPMPKDSEQLNEFVEYTRENFIKKARQVIKEINPNVLVSHNGAGSQRRLEKYVDYLTIETHPGRSRSTGGWISSLAQYKYMQSYDMPFETCTDRFLHGWGSFDIQTVANLMINSSRIMAHGGVINLGDQTYPTGRLEPGVYEEIGKCFEFVMEREKWCMEPERVPYIALLVKGNNRRSSSHNGAVKVLAEKHWHFDILDEEIIDRLPQYKAVICPNLGILKEHTVNVITDFVRSGGGLLATGSTSLNIVDEYPRSNFQLKDVLGIDLIGPSPYSTGYLELDYRIGKDVPDMPLLVIGQFNEIKPIGSIQVLADHRYPIIEARVPELIFRNRYSPPGKKSSSPGIVMNRFGSGYAAYCAAPIFETFWEENNCTFGILPVTCLICWYRKSSFPFKHHYQ